MSVPMQFKKILNIYQPITFKVSYQKTLKDFKHPPLNFLILILVTINYLEHGAMGFIHAQKHSALIRFLIKV